MRFENPIVLWLLLVIPPALLVLFWWSTRVKKALLARFITARLLPDLTVGVSKTRRKIKFGLLVAACAFLILALARPQWGFAWEEARLRGLDIVVALDTSKSMLAEDVAPNRLARAKLAVMDLLRVAKTDRIALVAFAGSAFLQCPLTFDEAAFRQSLESLDVGTIPEGGTAIAEAIKTANTAFKESDNYRIVVLFTDGEDQDPGALEAAREAAKSGLRLYTIGIGTPEGEVLRVKTGQGTTDYIRDEQGNVVKSHLNEEHLRDLAGATEGGFYLPLRGAKTVETLYSEGLSKLPKADRKERLVKRYFERFHWPLALAIALLTVEWLLPETPGRKRRNHSTAPQPAAALLSLLGIVFVFSSTVANASSAKALREYESGNYPGALEEYKKALKDKPDDARLKFNAGAAAYREGKFDDAVKHFSEALSTPDLKLQESAYYNRGNSFFYRGEKTQDPKQKQEAWNRSLQDFQSTLKLNPNDGNAQFNRQFVEKRLEELKQQQPPSQSQDKNDKPEDDQKQDNQQQQEQQQSQSDQTQDQQKQQQQQSQQSTGKPDQQQSHQPEQQEQQKSQQDSSKPDQQKPEEQQQQSRPAKPGDEKDQNSPSSAEQGKEEQSDKEKPPLPGQMSESEAKQVLDAQKGNEKVMPANGPARSDRKKPLRDW